MRQYILRNKWVFHDKRYLLVWVSRAVKHSTSFFLEKGSSKKLLHFLQENLAFFTAWHSDTNKYNTWICPVHLPTWALAPPMDGVMDNERNRRTRVRRTHTHSLHMISGLEIWGPPWRRESAKEEGIITHNHVCGMHGWWDNCGLFPPLVAVLFPIVPSCSNGACVRSLYNQGNQSRLLVRTREASCRSTQYVQHVRTRTNILN